MIRGSSAGMAIMAIPTTGGARCSVARLCTPPIRRSGVTSISRNLSRKRRGHQEHERTRLYIEAQKIFKDEQPFTPIAYPVAFQPVRKNVSHFKINPFDVTVFSGVTLK